MQINAINVKVVGIDPKFHATFPLGTLRVDKAPDQDIIEDVRLPVTIFIGGCDYVWDDESSNGLSVSDLYDLSSESGYGSMQVFIKRVKLV